MLQSLQNVIGRFGLVSHTTGLLLCWLSKQSQLDFFFFFFGGAGGNPTHFNMGLCFLEAGES